ncbi:MAG TPA: hypothetical protein PLP05_08760, partial [Sedimentisphaerales bacterium]|nr:hypothetical protein [Sedimentisphaerales bacterium]
MEKEIEKIFFSEDLPIESPEDMFVTGTSGSISESDVFVGTEDFHKTLSQPEGNRKKTKSSKRHYSITSKIMALAIITLLIIIICILSTTLLNKTTHQTITASANPTPSVDINTNKSTPSLPVGSLPTASQPQDVFTQPSEIPSEPVSLKYAEKLYLQRNYAKAFDMYKNIFERFSIPNTLNSKDDEMLRDLCRLKMSFCKKAVANLWHLPMEFDV